MALKPIQHVELTSTNQLESLVPLYYRSEQPVLTVGNGEVWLKQGASFDFFTYLNSFPLEAWKRYTRTRQFALVIDAVGRFDLDVVGYVPGSSHNQKEWGGRFSFDVMDREEMVIPIPHAMQSTVVSFTITCVDDTFIYGAHWAADVDDREAEPLEFAVVMQAESNPSNSLHSMATLAEALKEQGEYSNHIGFYVVDEQGVLEDGALPGVNVVVDPELSIPESVTHVVTIAEGATLHSDTLRRLYDFVSLMDDEHAEMSILGDVLKAEVPSAGVFVHFNEGLQKHTLLDSLAQYTYFDVAGVEGIVESECTRYEAGIYVPAALRCIPRDMYAQSLEAPVDAPHGYTGLADVVQNISMPGLCVWVNNLKQSLEQGRVTSDDSTVIFPLQKIIVPGDVEIEITRDMYYRSQGRAVLNDDDSIGFKTEFRYFDFFTYFNAFSLEKWKKYTHIDNVYLRVVAEGSFTISLMGHYKSKVGYQKEWLGEYEYDLPEKEELLIPYPRGMQSSLIAFQLEAGEDCVIHRAEYVTDIDSSKIRTPLISMVTTTFKKEAFIERNIELLTDGLLSDPEYRESFCWYIVDNGKTIDPPANLDDRITIVPNPNVGGAGGFARGMMESLVRKDNPTHILFMDDDVVFIPDSFKRLAKLLSVIKDEYAEHFISGAMLKTGQPNIQHENTAWLNELGYNEPIKTNYDLTKWDVIIANEEIDDSIPHRYAAFWFCCVPVGIASMENLPLPVFFRGDDIEYSLRNRAKLITMNGLCIWHEGFEGRFSASLDYYLTIRNKLALCAMNPDLDGVDVMGHIVENFWEEMHKFNYKGASLFLDAIEDFMKGPDFYRTNDGAANMVAKRGDDNKLRPINPEIRAQVNFEKLYQTKKLSAKKAALYESTHNGQEAAATPDGKEEQGTPAPTRRSSSYAKRTAVIPYGWGSFPSAIYMADEVIAVDPPNDTYVLFTKDVAEYERVKTRFETIMSDYEARHTDVIEQYREARSELTSEEFWDDYLERLDS